MSTPLTNEEQVSWTEARYPVSPHYCGACGGHRYWTEFHNGAKVRVPCPVCNKTALGQSHG